jgi:hypothetical protein
MSNDPNFHPRVYSTGEGQRSTAGSSYGDWRPTGPQRPHGFDFEKRFLQPHSDDRVLLDPDYRRLRDEHERELDAHYPHWLRTRYERFAEDFGRWREQRQQGVGVPSGQEPGDEAPSQAPR